MVEITKDTINLVDTRPGPMFCGIEINNPEQYNQLKNQILRGQRLIELLKWHQKLSIPPYMITFLQNLLDQSKMDLNPNSTNFDK